MFQAVQSSLTGFLFGTGQRIRNPDDQVSRMRLLENLNQRARGLKTETCTLVTPEHPGMQG